jgi:hypothetical protein
VPTAKVCWAAKEDVAAPAAVVFNGSDTVLELRLLTARSGQPSPLKSPQATELGLLPRAKVVGSAK